MEMLQWIDETIQALAGRMGFHIEDCRAPTPSAYTHCTLGLGVGPGRSAPGWETGGGSNGVYRAPNRVLGAHQWLLRPADAGLGPTAGEQVVPQIGTAVNWR